MLKVPYACLQKATHAIEAPEDLTLGTLTVPQARPEQLRHSKAVAKDHLDVAVEHLTSDR